ncbi:MAG TPA: NAD-dependent epimerase/dehydratase family protein [Thermoanaerobaculia bacterium]|nr:NAD-dependent epimerase/dehydratase family protein [Thermoanaerobaculia bacterium]
MRVLVVGGTGFLGTRVVTRLSQLGHEVAVYHRGVTEPALPFGVRHVHSPDAALPVRSFPEELTGIAWDVVLATSPIGARDAGALMSAFRGVARRVVALSSGDVYRAYEVLRAADERPIEPMPLTEDAPLRETYLPYRNAPGLPPHLFEYEKIFVEREVMSDPDLPGTVLRLPAIYGPGDAQHRLRPFWRRIERGMPVVLGREQAAFRWTHGYVEDVAEAVVLAVCRERAKGRVYNVGEADAPTTAQRIDAFGRALGWKGSVVAVDESSLPAHLAASPGAFRQDLIYDTSRIRGELDWKEAVPADEAFRRTAAWEASCVHVDGEKIPSEEEYALEAEAAGAAEPPLPFPDSLCHACAAPPKYVRTKRSVFIFCPLFRRYPPQPVHACPKFVPKAPAAGI